MVHKTPIDLAPISFLLVCTGQRKFIIDPSNNPPIYNENDIIIIQESEAGKKTGKTVEALITNVDRTSDLEILSIGLFLAPYFANPGMSKARMKMIAQFYDNQNKET